MRQNTLVFVELISLLGLFVSGIVSFCALVYAYEHYGYRIPFLVFIGFPVLFGSLIMWCDYYRWHHDLEEDR